MMNLIKMLNSLLYLFITTIRKRFLFFSLVFLLLWLVLNVFPALFMESGRITEVSGSKNDPKINSLARFAIEQHNKKENAILEFVKVVNAKQQIVEGMLYYITLEAKVGEKVNVYEAKVWERLWLNLTELTQFKLIGQQETPINIWKLIGL